MGRGSNDTNETFAGGKLGARRQIPAPPDYGNLSGAFAELRDKLLAGRVPAWPLPVLNEAVARMFSEGDREQEWRHWSQHLLGTVSFRLEQGQMRKAYELCAHYGPKLATYEQIAAGGSILEKELWQRALDGHLSVEDVLAQRQAIVLHLVTIDKERAMRAEREQPIQDLIDAVERGEQDAALEALARTKPSRRFDEESLAWALDVYKLLGES